MKLNNKEKYIKQVLESQDSPVNKSALWDAIEERVPFTESKPKRRLWIYILPFFLGALAISSVWYVTNQMSLPVKTVSQSKENLNNPRTPEAQNPQTALLNQTTGSQQTEESTRVNQTEVVSNKTVNTKAMTSGQTAQATAALLPQVTTMNINQAQILEQTQTPTRKNTVGESQVNTNTNTNPTVTLSAVGQELQRQDSARTPNNSNSKQTPAEFLPDSESEVKPLVQLVSVIGRLKATVLLIAEPLLGRLNASLSEMKTTDTTVKQNATWTLIANAGTNLVNSNASVKSGSKLRIEEFANEQNLMGYQGGIGLQRLSHKGWSVKAQLGMTTNVTRYQTDEQLLIKDEVDAVTEIYNGNTVNSVEVTGQAQTFTQVNQDVIWHRSHEQYNLDVFIGKQFNLNSKLTVLAEVGMLNTIYQKHTGYYFANSTQAFAKLTDGNVSPYQTGYRLNGALGTSILYKLNDRFSIGLGTSAVLPFDLLEDSQYYQSSNSQLRFDVLVGYKLNSEN